MNKKPREDEYAFGYYGIGFALGVSVSTLQRWTRRTGYKWSRWTPGKTGTIFIATSQIPALKRAFQRSRRRIVVP